MQKIKENSRFIVIGINGIEDKQDEMEILQLEKAGYENTQGYPVYLAEVINKNIPE